MLIVAELRKLEKQVLQGEISYSRMVEIINEKCESDAVEFAEWLRKDWRPLAPNKNDWTHNATKDIVKTTELYNIFKQLKK